MQSRAWFVQCGFAAYLCENKSGYVIGGQAVSNEGRESTLQDMLSVPCTTSCPFQLCTNLDFEYQMALSYCVP